MGYYDLRNPETRQAQARLAREFGIDGFCYYHYWFNGKRLLERPFNEVLASGKPDFPFCLCWANEDWTRAWDGLSSEYLIQQVYGDEDDRAHIHSLFDTFRDHRYIRVNDKPLFIVYRASWLPDPLRTTEIWREEARKHGVGELFLCRVESLLGERTDPTRLGFDAAIEFHPDWNNLGIPVDPNSLTADPSEPDPSKMDMGVYEYFTLFEQMLDKPDPEYIRFPCVVPSWDNTVRRSSGAVIVRNSSPAMYRTWLHTALYKAASLPNVDPLVFVNAWNEWGEGCHLEPDMKFGRGYLIATKEAVEAAHAPVEAHTGPKVSVVIPNYNGGRLLEKRIQSILDQTVQDFEIIFLDDASTDGSLQVISRFDEDQRLRVIRNKRHSGNRFRQWNKGFAEAKGEYIWIAESEDYADPQFLETMIPVLERYPSTGLACCGSRPVDEDGHIGEPDPTDLWLRGWFGKSHDDYVIPGREDGAANLAILNIIPSAGSVLLKKRAVEDAGSADSTFKTLGDWMLWARIVNTWDMVFVTNTLNWRRLRREATDTGEVKSLDYVIESYRIARRISETVTLDTDTLRTSREHRFKDWAVSNHHKSFGLFGNLRVFLQAREFDPNIRSMPAKLQARLTDKFLSPVRRILGRSGR